MKYIEDTTELNLLSNSSNNSPQKKKKYQQPGTREGRFP